MEYRVTSVTCRVQMVKKLNIGNAKLTMQVCPSECVRVRAPQAPRFFSIPTRPACIARGLGSAGEGHAVCEHDH